jgi:hypothetical protein
MVLYEENKCFVISRQEVVAPIVTGELGMTLGMHYYYHTANDLMTLISSALFLVASGNESA